MMAATPAKSIMPSYGRRKNDSQKRGLMMDQPRLPQFIKNFPNSSRSSVIRHFGIDLKPLAVPLVIMRESHGHCPAIGLS
jgi:hypothetical protein